MNTKFKGKKASQYRQCACHFQSKKLITKHIHAYNTHSDKIENAVSEKLSWKGDVVRDKNESMMYIW